MIEGMEEKEEKALEGWNDEDKTVYNSRIKDNNNINMIKVNEEGEEGKEEKKNVKQKEQNEDNK